jgi:hypothetical protein
VVMAIREWLRMLVADLYCYETCRIVPIWGKCDSIAGDC